MDIKEQINNLKFSSFEITRLQFGTKRIAANIEYNGDRKYYSVYYFDDTIKYGCARRPTEAKSEVGAKREITKFFNN